MQCFSSFDMLYENQEYSSDCAVFNDIASAKKIMDEAIGQLEVLHGARENLLMANKDYKVAVKSGLSDIATNPEFRRLHEASRLCTDILGKITQQINDIQKEILDEYSEIDSIKSEDEKQARIKLNELARLQKQLRSSKLANVKIIGESAFKDVPVPEDLEYLLPHTSQDAPIFQSIEEAAEYFKTKRS